MQYCSFFYPIPPPSLASGSLYKSFLVSSATMVEELVAQALSKANMGEQDPSNYTVIEVYQGYSQPVILSVVLYRFILSYSQHVTLIYLSSYFLVNMQSVLAYPLSVSWHVILPVLPFYDVPRTLLHCFKLFQIPTNHWLGIDQC